MDQAIHKMNVGHYTLDVKVSQLLDRLSRVDGKTIISSGIAALPFTAVAASAQYDFFFLTTYINTK